MGPFDFLVRVMVTDIRPDVFHPNSKIKSKEIYEWVIKNFKDELSGIEDGKFYEI